MNYSLFSNVLLLADLVIRIGLSARVIMRKRPYGVSLAWLVVILLVPFFGGFVYLLFGENRIPEKRSERAKVSYRYYQSWLRTLQQRAPVIWNNLNPECVPLHRLAENLVGLPAMAGNRLTLIENGQDFANQLIAAIEKATSTCHMQFYIWQNGGQTEEIIKALMNAAARGVTCRLLLDAIGSREFLKSSSASRMQAAGIKIRESLPAGIIKALFSRIDIRNHRKIVLIDGTVAFTGSRNMVDPAVFKLEYDVGNWVDIMVKVEGPVVESLAGTFISDWYLDAEDDDDDAVSLQKNIAVVSIKGDIRPQPPMGPSPVQLVPSGPGFVPETIHSLLLTTIYGARRELIMTTPYFIPDEPLLIALKAAAQRGVEVTIIVPRRNDSKLVYYASRARFEELVEAGVKIRLFDGGLLHSKTITVDRSFSLFGSVNLDMRSFWLNLEATLFIYCVDFTNRLFVLQQSYSAEAPLLDLTAFKKRGFLAKFMENTCLLVSPLL